MLGRLFTVVVLGLFVVSLTGCAGADTGRDATPVEPATGVCRDIAGCQVVATTDVDGDGVRDQVGFVVDTKRHVVVHVKTALGRLMSRGLDVIWFPRGEFYGAAPIDGRPGAELVVGTTMGAHTMFFTTLTARSGRLVRLEPPGGDSEWMIDAAYSFHAGVTRRLQDGSAVVVLRDAGRDGLHPVFSGRDRTFVWRDGGWQHQSTTRRRYRGEDAVAPVGGWHVAGLHRFPEF
jgi:hypothetical protein